jgi:hypothetical protein
MNDTIDLITNKEDFENIDEYMALSDKDKKYVWQYAKRKLIDYLMHDYDLNLKACVEGALSLRKYEENKDKEYQ